MEDWYKLDGQFSDKYVKLEAVSDLQYLGNELWKAGEATRPVVYRVMEGSQWCDFPGNSLLTPVLVSQRVKRIFECAVDDLPLFVAIEIEGFQPPAPLYAMCRLRQVPWVKGAPREDPADRSYVECDPPTLRDAIVPRRSIVVLENTTAIWMSSDVVHHLKREADDSLETRPISKTHSYRPRTDFPPSRQSPPSIKSLAGLVVVHQGMTFENGRISFDIEAQGSRFARVLSMEHARRLKSYLSSRAFVLDTAEPETRAEKLVPKTHLTMFVPNDSNKTCFPILPIELLRWLAEEFLKFPQIVVESEA